MPIVTESAMSFCDSVEDLLRRVDCRRVDSASDREEIYRLRYDAYLREGAIAPNASGTIFDRFDETANSQVFGIYLDGCLASSVRLSVGTPASSDTPAGLVFPDVLEPVVAAGRTFIDPTRFVVDARQARLHPKLLYVTLRLAWLATEHFDADDALASVRTEHQAFYKRFYGHVVLCPPREYPSLIKPLSLMLLDFRPTRERGLRRYPFLRSDAAERDALFGTVCRWPDYLGGRRPADIAGGAPNAHLYVS